MSWLSVAEYAKKYGKSNQGVQWMIKVGKLKSRQAKKTTMRTEVLDQGK